MQIQMTWGQHVDTLFTSTVVQSLGVHCYPGSCQSPTQSEYVGMYYAVSEVMSLRNMMDELGYGDSEPTLVHEDNEGSIIGAIADSNTLSWSITWREMQSKKRSLMLRRYQQLIKQQTWWQNHWQRKIIGDTQTNCSDKAISISMGKNNEDQYSDDNYNDEWVCDIWTKTYLRQGTSRNPHSKVKLEMRRDVVHRMNSSINIKEKKRKGKGRRSYSTNSIWKKKAIHLQPQSFFRVTAARQSDSSE